MHVIYRYDCWNVVCYQYHSPLPLPLPLPQPLSLSLFLFPSLPLVDHSPFLLPLPSHVFPALSLLSHPLDLSPSSPYLHLPSSHSSLYLHPELYRTSRYWLLYPHSLGWIPSLIELVNHVWICRIKQYWFIAWTLPSQLFASHAVECLVTLLQIVPSPSTLTLPC